MATAWSADMLKVEPRTITVQGMSQQVLLHGSTLDIVVRMLGAQAILALRELGYTVAGAWGTPAGFNVKELAVTPDGRRAVIHLSTLRRTLLATRNKPLPYISLISDKVVEQLRIRMSDAMGGPVEVGVDNHYWVRYVVDLGRLLGGAAGFPSGNLADYLADVPPFHFPWGLDRNGQVAWHDVREGYHTRISGNTGAGKSTWLQAVIMTLLARTPPEELKLLLLDPEGSNFGLFRYVPEYSFCDRQGAVLLATTGADIVDAIVRLKEEYARRVELFTAADWNSIETYNAHVAAEARLPYIAVFTDELANMRRLLDKKQVAVFDAALTSLMQGARKTGLRIFLCLQYLRGDTVDTAVAAQARLVVAFQDSVYGSRNALGDTAAVALRDKGRFIVEGLPGGRVVFQGLYMPFEEIRERMRKRQGRATFPVDGLVYQMLDFALQTCQGELNRDALAAAFAGVSARQVNHLLAGLERVGLAMPPDRSAIPPKPRRLKIAALEDAREVLQYHPEIAFHEETGPEGMSYIFGG